MVTSPLINLVSCQPGYWCVPSRDGEAGGAAVRRTDPTAFLPRG